MPPSEPSAVPSAPAGVERARRRGRLVGTVVHAALLSVFTLVCTVQILQQAWADAEPPPGLDCHAAARGLVAALDRARAAAARAPDGEAAALAAFRGALEPEWSARPGVGRLCRGEPREAELLVMLDRLRYAEEAATRTDSVDVARRRRRVAALLGEARSAP